MWKGRVQELHCQQHRNHEGMHIDKDYEWLHGEPQLRQSLFEPLRVEIVLLEQLVGDVEPKCPLPEPDVPTFNYQNWIHLA